MPARSALTRRELLRFVAAATAGTAAGVPCAAAQAPARPSRGLPLRITDVEVHEIVPPYQDYNAKHLYRYSGLTFQARAIFVVKTDLGIEGYGETGGGPAPARSTFAHLVGRSPFEEFARADHLGISMALHDVMGKYLGVPVWRLLGRPFRSWIPLSAWTISKAPAELAEEAALLARRGYGWLKFHVDVFQNAVDQTAAVHRAAPGLKLHYDFNGEESAAVVLPTLRELEKLPAAGRVEDPIRGDRPGDLEEWRKLRAKTRLQILASIQHGPEYLVEKAADGCVLSRAAIPEAMRVGSLAEAANTPFMLQQVGGNITLAFLAHEASVLRMATIDHVNCCHIWKDDVTFERLPVVGGRVRVPEGPGLGITLDRDRLKQYAAAPRPRRDRFLARMRCANGLTAYFRFPEDPWQAALAGLGRDDPDRHLPIPGPMYAKPVVTDFWDETGSPEFERIWPLTASGAYWTEGGPGWAR